MQITGQLDTLTEEIKAITQKSEDQGTKIDQIVSQLATQGRHLNALIDSLSQNRSTPNAHTDGSIPEMPIHASVRPQETSSPAQNPAPSSSFRRHDSGDARYNSRGQTYPSSSVVAPGNFQDNDVSEDTPMPAKHTTAAQNLLEWPSIKALIPKGTTPSYVMDEETNRGLLRLYGCGEGEDKNDGHEGAPSPAHSNSSEGRRMDDDSSSPNGVWGSGQFHVPLTNSNTNARDHPGGLSPTGGLMLESEAVDKYFRNFMENMHSLHPFLEAKVLRTMIHTFKRKYSWDYRAAHQVNAAIGHKRKRELTESPTPMDDFPRHSTRNVQPGTFIEHSVANAIVLLVLALGKVTAHRDPLPSPPSTATIRTSTPHSAMYSDLPLPVSAPTSPFNNNNINPNGNVSSPANPQGKNMDVIPGLAYFAKAADIIGELPGGSDVSHVQAYLLAGLYMGQLARIVPSHYYINKACNAAQILIESTEYVKKTMKPARRNLVNFAFWSCLQLESDIAAELGLPLSGIGRFEAHQLEHLPTDITMDPIPESNSETAPVLRYYSYQIQLRRTINSVHASLYRGSKTSTRGPPTKSLQDVLDLNLEDWRRLLGDWEWNDNNHESSDIQVSRMRGKYYGAKYIIWRPTLRYALEQAVKHRNRGHPSESPTAYHTTESTSPSVSNINLSQHHGQDLPIIKQEIFEGAKKCVEAAIRSTTAFDGVPRRLVVTNIFGTAHA
jgi:hypothetical protein